MNQVISTPQSSTAVRIDVYTILRELSKNGIYVSCPVDHQDKIVEVHVSHFTGLKINPDSKK